MWCCHNGSLLYFRVSYLLFTSCLLLFVYCLPAQNQATSTLDFKPTADFPALQYLDRVDHDSVADRAGLKAGDFVLEVSLSVCLSVCVCVCVVRVALGQKCLIVLSQSALPTNDL